MTIAFIHTSHVLAPVFQDLAKKELTGADVFHMADDSLIRNTIRAGRLEKNTVRRLLAMIGLARDGGADVVMVTCSSVGEVIPLARRMYDFPILRVDEAMAEKAISLGSRVGVAATLRTTLDPTIALLRAKAEEAGGQVEVLAKLCEGAFEAVVSGDAKTHDALVTAGLRELAADTDVIVLAQASMARVVESLPEEDRKVPILASPALAIQRLREQYLPAAVTAG